MAALFPAADRFDEVALALSAAQKQEVASRAGPQPPAPFATLLEGVPAWQRQFSGREGLDQLRFEADIKNIAGATLSCGHVTEGVRWLMALWEVSLRSDAAPA